MLLEVCLERAGCVRVFESERKRVPRTRVTERKAWLLDLGISQPVISLQGYNIMWHGDALVYISVLCQVIFLSVKQ